MKLLEEKGLRNKIINECIKYENEITEMADFWNTNAEESYSLNEKYTLLQHAVENQFAHACIGELRMRLMQLLDNEKVE